MGKGLAKAITDLDFAILADDLGCHPADLEAIAKVESRGYGWYGDGRMKILWEYHWFWKLLPNDAMREKARKMGLARRDWVSPKRGGYKAQVSADARYYLLQRGIALHPEAAYQSISMGTFQIMGFNHDICGFPTAQAMFEAFCDSEAAQIRAFASFLKGRKLLPALRSRDFVRIEQVYNGGGLNGAYATQMSDWSEELRKGKWRGYQAGGVAAPNPVPENPYLPPAYKEQPEEEEGKQLELPLPPPVPKAVVGMGLMAVISATVALWHDKISHYIAGWF